jgi:hypothetical protein
MFFAARGKSRLALSVITMRAQRWQLLGQSDRPVLRQPNRFTITPSNRDTGRGSTIPWWHGANASFSSRAAFWGCVQAGQGHS